MLEENEICLAEIEVVTGLGADGPGGERAAATEEVAWRMADEFECRYVQIIGPSGPDLARGGTRLRVVLRPGGRSRARRRARVPAVHRHRDVHDARRIIEAADRPNGGMCVDIWHHERGANDLPAIAALPGEMIKGIQMNDGTKRPQNDDYLTDCLENRCAPGDGEFDVRGFVDAIRAAGSDGSVVARGVQQ